MLLPTDRPPTHPGEMLLEEFIEPLELTQTEVAERSRHFLCAFERDRERTSWYHTRHGASACPASRYDARFLVERPIGVGPLARDEVADGESDQEDRPLQRSA